MDLDLPRLRVIHSASHNPNAVTSLAKTSRRFAIFCTFPRCTIDLPPGNFPHSLPSPPAPKQTTQSTSHRSSSGRFRRGRPTDFLNLDRLAKTHTGLLLNFRWLLNRPGMDGLRRERRARCRWGHFWGLPCAFLKALHVELDVVQGDIIEEGFLVCFRLLCFGPRPS